jgi:hypothetical protein
MKIDVNMENIMKKINKHDTPQQLSTSDEFLQKLTPKQRKKFDTELREFALSELLLAIMEQDNLSIRRLAKLADVSPSIIQSMRSAEKKDYTLTVFLKVLKGLGCKKLKVEYKGKNINLPFSTLTLKK